MDYQLEQLSRDVAVAPSQLQPQPRRLLRHRLDTPERQAQRRYMINSIRPDGGGAVFITQVDSLDPDGPDMFRFVVEDAAGTHEYEGMIARGAGRPITFTWRRL